MWRKPEAKPSSPASNAPAPASTPEKPKETPQTVSQQAPATASGLKTSPAPVAAKPGPPEPSAPAVAKSAPVAAASPAVAPQRTRVDEASTISAGLKIKGEITGTSDLTVDGETQGKIRLTNGRVTIGASGRVTADIDAREIVVNGTVQGNLKASESVRLGPSGHVEGSILTARIGIDDGARLRGNVEMIRAGETPESSRREPEQPTAQAQAARVGSTAGRQE